MDVVEGNIIAEPVHVIASPFKTGTSSVGQALKDLGVGKRLMPHDGKLLRANRKTFKKAEKFVRKNQKFKNFHAAHAEHVLGEMAEFLPRIARFDIFHDAPVGHSHIHPFVLKTVMPEARFIWVHRPLDEWIESVRKWELGHPDTYRRASEWHTNPEARAAEKLAVYQARLTQFHRIRRACPKDCLELQWEDLGSFDKLAAFYGCPIPSRQFPTLNVAQS